MTVPTGRFSRFPAIDRSVPRAASTAPASTPEGDAEAQRLTVLLESLSPIEAAPGAEVAVEPVVEVQVEPVGAPEVVLADDPINWPNSDELASRKVVEILDWAGESTARRAYAFSAESAHRGRTTALEGLQPPVVEKSADN